MKSARGSRWIDSEGGCGPEVFHHVTCGIYRARPQVEQLIASRILPIRS
jgi:hypothetical protein